MPGCDARWLRAWRGSAAESGEVAVLVGYPEYADQHIYNSVALFAGGRQLANYRKCCLPNYSVFDEERYFTPGGGPVVVEFRGFKLGLGICEDIWEPGLPARAVAAGAELLLVINGSPFEIGKQAQREAGDRGARPGNRRAAGLSQPGRRPGRAGFRRRLLCG